MGKIDTTKPYIEFQIPDDPEEPVKGEAFNNPHRGKKCVASLFRLLKGAFTGDPSGMVSKEKEVAPPIRRNINREVGGM